MENRPAKKRLVVSYANMSEEVALTFKEKYPKGYLDYCGEIITINKPDGSVIYAVPVEFPDASYLVKVDVKVDDYEDVKRAMDGGEEPEETETPDIPDDSDEVFGKDAEGDDMD